MAGSGAGDELVEGEQGARQAGPCGAAGEGVRREVRVLRDADDLAGGRRVVQVARQLAGEEVGERADLVRLVVLLAVAGVLWLAARVQRQSATTSAN